LTPVPPPPAATGLRAVLAERAFMRFLAARFAASFAVQMQTVAVGVQVYTLTHDPLDLGLVGLSQFLPFIACVLPAGHVADRFDRKSIVLVCLAVQVLCAVALAAFTAFGMQRPLPVFAVMIAFGISRAFNAPANNALMPNLVPAGIFGSAVAINSSTWQLATIAGPALGGVLYAATGPATVYGIVALLLGLSVLSLSRVPAPATAVAADDSGWQSVIDGLTFVWHRKVVLGAISMDLFAVLFGGATALLPAYADKVLHIGVAGIGWLRAAPGVGAALTAACLALRPIGRHAGRAMFSGVAVFGIATIAFGVSTSFWLSMLALAALGAADMVSVFVRHVLVQLETPDAMRGRVGAVSYMFIGASNELGEFESGLTASWWGLKPAVVVGGIATLAVAALWMRLFPGLRRLDRFGSS
jgi:MFS family permease